MREICQDSIHGFNNVAFHSMPSCLRTLPVRASGLQMSRDSYGAPGWPLRLSARLQGGVPEHAARTRAARLAPAPRQHRRLHGPARRLQVVYRHVPRQHCWAHKLRNVSNLLACLERELDELLAHSACPEAHRLKVRTTNAIERCFREVRRRTRPMSCFANDASCERIIYAVASHLN
jgi:mutator family transposase